MIVTEDSILEVDKMVVASIFSSFYLEITKVVGEVTLTLYSTLLLTMRYRTYFMRGICNLCIFWCVYMCVWGGGGGYI